MKNSHNTPQAHSAIIYYKHPQAVNKPLKVYTINFGSLHTPVQRHFGCEKGRQAIAQFTRVPGIRGATAKLTVLEPQTFSSPPVSYPTAVTPAHHGFISPKKIVSSDEHAKSSGAGSREYKSPFEEVASRPSPMKGDGFCYRKDQSITQDDSLGRGVAPKDAMAGLREDFQKSGIAERHPRHGEATVADNRMAEEVNGVHLPEKNREAAEFVFPATPISGGAGSLHPCHDAIPGLRDVFQRGGVELCAAPPALNGAALEHTKSFFAGDWAGPFSLAEAGDYTRLFEDGPTHKPDAGLSADEIVTHAETPPDTTTAGLNSESSGADVVGTALNGSIDDIFAMLSGGVALNPATRSRLLEAAQERLRKLQGPLEMQARNDAHTQHQWESAHNASINSQPGLYDGFLTKKLETQAKLAKIREKQESLSAEQSALMVDEMAKIVISEEGLSPTSPAVAHGAPNIHIML